MSKSHAGPHDGTHDGCFGCRIKHVGIAASAMPTRTKIQRNADGTPKLRPMADPSWEKGVAGEHRPGGGFMPLLDERGSEVGVKQFAENRSRYTERLRQLRSKG